VLPYSSAISARIPFFCAVSTRWSENRLVGQVGNLSYVFIRHGVEPGMKNRLENFKTICFTYDIPQRALSGGPVQHDDRRSSLLGAHAAPRHGELIGFLRLFKCPVA
jgi:hypothetical protein